MLFNMFVAVSASLEFPLTALDGTLKSCKTPLMGLCVMDRQPHTGIKRLLTIWASVLAHRSLQSYLRHGI